MKQIEAQLTMSTIEQVSALLDFANAQGIQLQLRTASASAGAAPKKKKQVKKRKYSRAKPISPDAHFMMAHSNPKNSRQAELFESLETDFFVQTYTRDHRALGSHWQNINTGS